MQHDLVIRGREKRRTKIYESFEGTIIAEGRREGIHRVYYYNNVL